MKLVIVFVTFCASIRFSAAFNLGLFETFLTTPSTNDPTMCHGRPRTWSFCAGTSNPTRYTTDDCLPKVTEVCSSGTMQASHFIASSISASSPASASRCRRFTHEHEYIEESHEQSSFLKDLLRERRSQPVRSANVTINKAVSQSIIDIIREPLVEQSRRPATALSGCTRRKRQANVVAPKRDIAIVIDESGSIGEENFGQMKRIAAAFVKLLCGAQGVNPSQTRVSVTSFDKVIHHHKDLIQGSTTNPLNNNADYLSGFINFGVEYNSHTHGATCLVKTLDFVKDTVLNSHGARRGQPGVVQEIFLLSDGCEYCGSPKKSIAAAAQRLQSAGIDVYVIGFALGNVCQAELDVLIEGGKCFHFFNIVDWMSNLHDFIEQMENPPTLPNGQRFCLPQLYTGSSNCADPNPSG